MSQGDKRSYTNKQKRQAEHIEKGYEECGISKETAKARAWATVNKMDHGGKKSGSGRGKRIDKSPARKSGHSRSCQAVEKELSIKPAGPHHLIKRLASEYRLSPVLFLEAANYRFGHKTQ